MVISEVPRRARWAFRVIALPVLGACVLSAIAWQLIPNVANDDFEWLNSRWTRTVISIGLLAFAVWASGLISRDPARVELDKEMLSITRFAGGPQIRESLLDLKSLQADGTVEFRNGRKVSLGGHPLILAELRERLARRYIKDIT
jgi:type VI protein secretion system component VasK